MTDSAPYVEVDLAMKKELLVRVQNAQRGRVGVLADDSLMEFVMTLRLCAVQMHGRHPFARAAHPLGQANCA
jgi:phosphoribosylanthranilate isomerase